MDIEWDEPPAEVVERQTLVGGHYVEFALALREHREKWALMPAPKQGETRTDNSGKALAQNIRRGKVKGFTAGEYEAVSDSGKVWVRYLGPKAVTAAAKTSQPPKADSEYEDLARKARQWAIDQGQNIPRRGNLSRNVIVAYCQAKGITPPGHRPLGKTASLVGGGRQPEA